MSAMRGLFVSEGQLLPPPRKHSVHDGKIPYDPSNRVVVREIPRLMPVAPLLHFTWSLVPDDEACGTLHTTSVETSFLAIDALGVNHHWDIARRLRACFAHAEVIQISEITMFYKGSRRRKKSRLQAARF